MRRILVCTALVLAVAGAAAAPASTPRGRWIEVRTDNFILFSNAREGLTRKIGLNLERLRKALSLLSEDLEVNSPLPTYIYVFKGHGSFEDYVRSEDSSPTVGMFVSHRDGNYVAINAAIGVDPYDIVYHEYLHYYLNNNTSAAIPVWFDEGVAEFYSTFKVRENEVDIGKPVQRHLDWLRTNPALPLGRLFAVRRDSPEYNGDKNGVFYAQSWAVVHILFAGKPDRWPKLIHFLELLEEGRRVSQALVEALGTTADQLDEDLSRLIRASELPFTRYTFADLAIDEEVSVVSMSDADVLFRLGDYLTHADPDRSSEAEEHFRAALKIQADHPGAIAGLGFVRELDDDLDEAARFYTWALELDGGDYLTSFLLAQNLLERYYRSSTGKIEPSTALPRRLARARELYRRCIERKPGLAAAYAGFGYTYLYDPGDPAPGVIAMKTAHRLMPHDLDVAYGLMLLHLKNGDRDDAERLARVLQTDGDTELALLTQEALLTNDLNAANQALAEERLNEGLALIRKVIAETTDMALADDLRKQAWEIETVLEANRWIFLYNDALELVRNGRLSDAEANLERILVGTRDPELAASARELMGIIDKRRAGP